MCAHNHFGVFEYLPHVGCTEVVETVFDDGFVVDVFWVVCSGEDNNICGRRMLFRCEDF